MDKIKNLKVPFRFGSIVVTIIEIIIVAVVFPKYEGVISYGFFIVLILMQPIWYFNLTNSESKIYNSKRFKAAAIILITISISIPILMYAATPQYSYDHGVDILQKHLESEEDSEFLIDDKFRSTIWVTGFDRAFPKNILMNDRFYLYLAFNSEGAKQFALNPLTGEVIEIKE